MAIKYSIVVTLIEYEGIERKNENYYKRWYSWKRSNSPSSRKM